MLTADITGGAEADSFAVTLDFDHVETESFVGA